MNSYFAASAILLSCFVILAFLISPKYDNTSINAKDTDAFLKVNKSHYLPFDKLMVLFADYGREMVWAVTMILLFVFGGISGRKTSIILFLTIIVLVPSVFVAKEMVERPRPSDIPNAEYLIKPEGEYSYPSGHATIVSAGAATLLVLFRDSSRKLAIAIGLTVEAALVCISVVYVGVHYPLDVLGGILFGTGVSFIFLGFVKHFEKIILSVTRIFRR